jgi:uncharacterized membrane protein
MKQSMIIGIILIVLGAGALIFQGVTYTTREKVADIGSIHVTVPKQNTIPIPGIVGGLCLVGGIAIVVVASKKSA